MFTTNSYVLSLLNLYKIYDILLTLYKFYVCQYITVHKNKILVSLVYKSSFMCLLHYVHSNNNWN